MSDAASLTPPNPMPLEQDQRISTVVQGEQARLSSLNRARPQFFGNARDSPSKDLPELASLRHRERALCSPWQEQYTTGRTAARQHSRETPRTCRLRRHGVPCTLTPRGSAPGRPRTGAKGRRSAHLTRFSCQRTSFCFAQASAGLEWAAGVLPGLIPCWLPLCRVAESCAASDPRPTTWHRPEHDGLALAKPEEASDASESPCSSRQRLLTARNAAGQGRMTFR